MRACHTAFLDLLKDIVEGSHDGGLNQMQQYKKLERKNLKHQRWKYMQNQAIWKGVHRRLGCSKKLDRCYLGRRLRDTT